MWGLWRVTWPGPGDMTGVVVTVGIRGQLWAWERGRMRRNIGMTARSDRGPHPCLAPTSKLAKQVDHWPGTWMVWARRGWPPGHSAGWEGWKTRPEGKQKTQDSPPHRQEHKAVGNSKIP